MKLATIVRQATGGILTAFATLSVGIMAVFGALVFSSSFLWCIAAFILAAAFESQVNGEGIKGALERIFDPNYLRLGIVERYLDELLDQKEFTQIDNLFFNEYREQKNYIERLENYIHHQRIVKASYLPFIEKRERHAISLLIKEKKQALKKAKKRLRKMQLFFLKNLTPHLDEDEELTLMERAVLDLVAKRKNELLTEMQRKAFLIKFGWILAIGAGASSGLSTLSALKAGMLAFSFLNVVPGGVLVALCAGAAIGYTLLIYRSMSDMIQQYSSRTKSFFSRRVNAEGVPESRAFYVLRCVGAVFAIALGIFATLSTAGTWWYAAKNGAAILGAAEVVASTLRSITISLMVVPTFVFNAHNSVESVDNMSRSDYIKFFVGIKNNIVSAYQNENMIRFANPFRILEKVISYTTQWLLLQAHTLSIGISSDRCDYVPPEVSTSLNAATETLTDLNFMPDKKKENSHHSLVLAALFFPIALLVGTLKVFSSCWDYVFSSPRDIKTSFKKMFCKEAQDTPLVEPVKPALSLHWRKQELIETCDKERVRLKNLSLPKVSAAKKLRNTITHSQEKTLDRASLETQAIPFAVNRHNFWKQKVTKSERKIQRALDTYFSPQVGA